MAGSLRKLDAFVKTRPELRTQSALGGTITLCAATVAILLLIAQVYVYTIGSPQNNLHLSVSRSIPILPLHRDHLALKMLENAGKIPLTFLVSFPHTSCEKLDVNLDGASYRLGELQKAYSRSKVTMRELTLTELQQATGTEITKSTPGLQKQLEQGCTVEGRLRIPIVAGSLAITLNAKTWAMATQVLAVGMFFDSSFIQASKEQLKQYNTSHYIHYIRFGQTFPMAQYQPLENRAHMNTKDSITLEQVLVKLVPTLYPSWFQRKHSYQMSVVEHQITAESLIIRRNMYMPGLRLSYDFTPLAVHHSRGRNNFLVFLSSLVSIVGGVYVTVSLVTGCLVHSAAAVAKKVD